MKKELELDSFSVLIIEDDLDQQLIMKKVLVKEGFDVEFSTTSDKALEILNTKNFDCVLLDYNLAPESSQDGIGTLKEIRREDLSVGVIMMTAYGTQDVAIEAIRHQSDDFLIKPIDYSNLGQNLKNIIKKRRELYPDNSKSVILETKININPFDNFIVLKNSIPMFIKGEWTSNVNKDKVQSNSGNSFNNQLLMSSFLNAMQTVSKSIFGQSVNELTLGDWNIIFKQREMFLCGVKLKNFHYSYFLSQKSKLDRVFKSFEKILSYLEKESKKGEIIKLEASQRSEIEKILSKSHKNLVGGKSKMSFLKNLFSK